MEQKIIKTDAVNGNVEDADVVICYGNINGSVKKCQYVVLIDGAINGHIINIKWFLITMGILVFVVFGLILICRFIDRKFMKKENKNE